LALRVGRFSGESCESWVVRMVEFDVGGNGLTSSDTVRARKVRSLRDKNVLLSFERFYIVLLPLPTLLFQFYEILSK
jgi:hypothetical protein